MASHPLIERIRIYLDPGAAEPLSRQVSAWIWREVVEGGLPSGERLPTVREMAIGLEVSPRSVERAYRELERMGVAATRPGEGTFISLSPPPEEERARRRAFAEICREAVERSRELGFNVDELLDEIRDWRSPS
ncbi:MAG: GntR family transcriptional regulator [Gemmatimonadales bacterium]|nr:MAG: GntR family transcriptional regulator [Gemmatimonadales bacterium]